MTPRPPALQIPRRFQRVIHARWLFGGLLLLLGLLTLAASGGRQRGGLVAAGLVLVVNTLFTTAGRRETARPRRRFVAVQLLFDSLATVAAVQYGEALTPAVQFLFLFPLFTATLLSPREGLFLTAAVCGLGYATTELLSLTVGPPRGELLADAALRSFVAVTLVGLALLAAAAVNNYLVRVLAGIEADLTESEARYRDLANSLEDEVRQRTGDLRGVNEALNRRNRELLRLREIDAAIHESDDLGTVLQRIVDGVAEIVPGAQAAIYLRDLGAAHLRLARFSTSAERRVAAIESLVNRRLREVRLPLAECPLMEQALGRSEALPSPDLERLLADFAPGLAQRGLVGDVVRILGCQSYLAVPLVVGDELIGLLGLGARQPLTGHDLERIEAFATQAAMAVVRVQQERNLLEQQAALQEAYRELAHSQEQVINLEKMRAIAEMTSGVAHNFNNALTAILGTAQLVLLDQGLSQPVIHRLRIIERTAQDAALLVQRIRAFTKEEPPQTTAADVNELVTDAVAMTEPRWKHHPDRVESPIAVELDLRAQNQVEADPAAIREVLINLILNSVNALPEGGHIRVRTWDDADRVLVAIRDTGTGMSDETRQRCFEPFYTTGADKGGTGLGLSVAYGIIQRHNGEIRVTSSLGVGTEFTLALPTCDLLEPRPVATAEAAQPVEATPLHALVVDDQLMVRQTLAEMLRALGHDATVAADGREAIELFDPTRHQVVITDWGMPGMSGLAVARAVKVRSPHTPVVLVTGLDTQLPAEVVDADEVDTRLQKPIGMKELQRTMGTLARP